MVYSEKLVKRYRELHQESLDCLLLMKVGAFMQVMDEEHCGYDRPTTNPLISSSQCNKKLLFSFTKSTALECRSNSLIQLHGHPSHIMTDSKKNVACQW
jgi:hypothetical protein